MPGKIFINYRRDNAIAAAGRLHDRLAQAFGRGNLFMDVDHIPAGVDFVTYLGEQVAQCDVFLAVMAPGWLEAQDANGARRIDSQDDFVAIEIAAALARDVRVIPVLIDGARMPAMAELPPGLQQLARRNAVEVRNSQFGRDADVLIEKIREAMKAAAVQARKPRPVASVPWGWVGSTAASVLMLGYVGAYYAGVPVWWPLAPPKPASIAPTPEQLAEAARRSVLVEQEKKAEAERQRVIALEAENKRLIDAAAQARRDLEARQKAETDAVRAKAELDRRAAEAERQKQAAAKAEEERQRQAAAKQAEVRGTPRSPAVSLSARPLYEEAYSFLLQQDCAAAEAGFAVFLQLHPQDELASNAQFWLGETFYVRGRFDSAAAAFLKVAQNYPGSAKAPDSLAKLAMSIERQGNKPAACRTWQELNARYLNPPPHVRTWETTERKRAGCSS